MIGGGGLKQRYGCAIEQLTAVLFNRLRGVAGVRTGEA